MLEEGEDVDRPRNAGPTATTGPGPANAGMY